MEVFNLFKNIPVDFPEEVTEKILETKNIRIERIISKGHTSPEDFWYDQSESEFVLVVKGSAKLVFKDDGKPISITSGGYINIPPHAKHRIEWTDPEAETIWLAVFY